MAVDLEQVKQAQDHKNEVAKVVQSAADTKAAAKAKTAANMEKRALERAHEKCMTREQAEEYATVLTWQAERFNDSHTRTKIVVAPREVIRDGKSVGYKVKISRYNYKDDSSWSVENNEAAETANIYRPMPKSIYQPLDRICKHIETEEQKTERIRRQAEETSAEDLARQIAILQAALAAKQG